MAPIPPAAIAERAVCKSAACLGVNGVRVGAKSSRVTKARRAGSEKRHEMNMIISTSSKRPLRYSVVRTAGLCSGGPKTLVRPTPATMIAAEAASAHDIVSLVQNKPVEASSRVSTIVRPANGAITVIGNKEYVYMLRQVGKMASMANPP